MWSLDTAGDQLQLTSGANDLQPAVDPTGQTVAFSRTEGTNATAGSGIYTVPIGGGAVSRLLDASWFAADPAWSPDGTKIAFAGGGHLIGQSLSRPSGIYVMSADGRGSPRLVYSGKTDFAVEGHPSWSPDGSKLVFQGGNAALSDPPNFDLYVIDSDLSGPAVDITNTPDSETGPAWSPDGSRIAFSLQPATEQGSLARPAKGAIGVVASDGSGRVLLTDGKALDTDPGWSPDGTLIAFARTINAKGESPPSYILEVTATGRPQIVSTSIIGSDPFWTKGSISGSPGARPPDFATIRGVPYPVCNVSSVSADFTGAHGIAYLFSRETGSTCQSVAEADNAFLALDRRGQGRPGDVTVSGAIDCFKGCRVFGAPDLDGDGRAELAVVVVDGDAADSIEFYKVVSSDAGPVFKQVTYGGTKAVYTDWGGTANYRSGVECQRALSLRLILNFKIGIRRGAGVETSLTIKEKRQYDREEPFFKTPFPTKRPFAFCGGRAFFGVGGGPYLLLGSSPVRARTSSFSRSMPRSVGTSEPRSSTSRPLWMNGAARSSSTQLAGMPSSVRRRRNTSSR